MRIKIPFHLTPWDRYFLYDYLLIGVYTDHCYEKKIQSAPCHYRSQFTITMPSRRRVKVWRLFVELEDDYTRVKCLVTGCTSIIRRGKAGSKRGELNSNNMVRHAKTHHPEEWKIVEEEEKQAAVAVMEQKEMERKKDETEKGGNKIWCLKSRKDRINFFKRVRKFIYY